MENHPLEEVFYYSKSAIKSLFINVSVSGGMLLFFIISAIVSFYYQKSFLFFTTGTTLYQSGFFVILLVGILCIKLFFCFIEYKKLKDDAPRLKFSVEGFYSKEFGFFTWGDIMIINIIFVHSRTAYGHYLSFSTKADKSYSVRIEEIDGYEKNRRFT